MRRFLGSGGCLYSLGERFSFPEILMDDCGDGWDWRSPLRFSYWCEKPTITVGPNREAITPVETFLGTGRVGLPRNMSRGQVFASGSCMPISFFCAAGKWELAIDAIVGNTTTLGDDAYATKTKITDITATLFDVEVPIKEVLVRLPHGVGMFVGVGNSQQVGDCAVIEFTEGIRYERW